MCCIKWRVLWRWVKLKHVRINTQFFINKFWDFGGPPHNSYYLSTLHNVGWLALHPLFLFLSLFYTHTHTHTHTKQGLCFLKGISIFILSSGSSISSLVQCIQTCMYRWTPGFLLKCGFYPSISWLEAQIANKPPGAADIVGLKTKLGEVRIEELCIIHGINISYQVPGALAQ